jgi:hypothetical protein
MKRIALALGLTAAFCGNPVFAVDLDPNARARAVDAAGKVAPVLAPTPSRNPLPDLNNGIDPDGRTLTGACSQTATDVCYDYKQGRLVYRSARNWMPEINGLKAEHVSVRRDKVVFQYSFK